MELETYLQKQENWIINEYMASYGILNYPAISYASWGHAEKQLKLINASQTKPLQWKKVHRHNGAARILEYPNNGFKQLWVEHTFRQYRRAAKNFLTEEWGISKNITKSIAVDHLVPKSRHKSQRGITVAYFIPANVNSSWGAGYEKSTKGHALKVRHQLTLVSVAKTVGIKGPKQPGGSKGVSYMDIAYQLHQKGVRSKMYESAKFNSWNDVEKIENEIKLAANYPGVEMLS